MGILVMMKSRKRMKKLVVNIVLISFFYLFIYFPLRGNHSYSKVDFLTSMGDRRIRFERWSQQDSFWYIFLQNLYERHILCLTAPEEFPKIPKIIHQIWLGSELPEKFKIFQKTWQELHPEWVYILWTDDMIKDLKIHNRELFEKAKNYGQKSDILRYHLLYEYGGVYIDTDFACLKSLDILHHCYDFYTGISNTGRVELAIGIIGSAPKHPIIKRCLEKLELSKNAVLASSRLDDIIENTGPGFFTRCFMEVAPWYQGQVIAFPCSFFYPLPNTERSGTKEEMDAFIKPESFGIHYWACSWQ